MTEPFKFVVSNDPAKARQAIGTLGVPADYDVSGSGDYMVNDVVRYTDPDGTSEEDATGLWRCTVDHTSDSPVESPSSWEWVGLTVRPDVPRFIDAGAFPWPQGLVGLWTFQDDRVGRSTVTSKVGSQSVVLMARGSKTVAKDDDDPGPFGSSLVLDGATVFVKDGDLGALDVSKTGDEVTVIAWVKDTAGTHDDTSPTNGIAFRAGSHCEPGDTAARQYGLYFDAHGALGMKHGHLTPHIGAQDGATPGYPYNVDYAGSHRVYFSGTGQNQWHMEAMTFDGAEIIAYVDGMTDTWSAPPVEPYFGGGQTSRRAVQRNPYPLRKGINRSQTTKRFSVGGSTQSNAGVVSGINFMTGKLGGVAVFNRALTANEIMQIRLATLLPGEPITMFSFEVAKEGDHKLDEIGWSARATANNLDVSTLTTTGSEYAPYRPTGGSKAYLKRTSTSVGACWGPVTGLNSSQLARVRFKLLSAAATAAAQRILVKVGSQWWASDTSFNVTGSHAGDTDWSAAETKTLPVDWNPGNWRAVTMSDTGGTATVTNLVRNPALNATATDWFVTGYVTHATGARTSTAGGFVYRLTWSGTDSASLRIGGTTQSTCAVTAGTQYAASIQVDPSVPRHMNLQLLWFDGSNNNLSITDGALTDVPSGSMSTLAAAGVAPTGAVSVSLRVQSLSGGGGPSWVSGDTLDITNALVEANSGASPYFDGATPGASWTGSVGGSTSTFTDMPTGVLSLDGGTNATYIDNALITAIGFLSSGGDGSAVRISDLELLPT